MAKIKELIVSNKDSTTIDLDYQYQQYIIGLKPVSNCCGADMSGLIHPDGPSFDDIGICPDCRDYCMIESESGK